MDANKYLSLLDSHGLHQHISEPTHIKGHTLDHLITRGCDVEIIDQISVDINRMSDHFPFTFVLRSKDHIAQPHVKLAKRKINAVDPKAFASDAQHEFSNVSIQTAESYHSGLCNLLDVHAPIRTKSVALRIKVPWYNSNVNLARHSQRIAERKWRSTKLEVHRQIYRAEHNRVVRTIERAKRDYYNNQIKQAADQGQLYRITNSLLNNKKQLILPDHVPGTEQHLANRFSQFFNNKIVDINKDLVNIRLSFPVSLDNVESESVCEVKLSRFACTSPDEICKIIRRSPSKTCNLDPIPTDLLKNEPVLNSLAPTISHIVNQSLNSGFVPDVFKEALVTPLLKSHH